MQAVVDLVVREFSRGDVPGNAAGEVRVLNDAGPVVTPKDHMAVQAFQRAVARVTGQPAPVGGVNYFTDSAVLTPAWDVPMLIFGPGRDDLAHQPNEHVEIYRLKTSAQIFREVILEMLG